MKTLVSTLFGVAAAALLALPPPRRRRPPRPSRRRLVAQPRDFACCRRAPILPCPNGLLARLVPFGDIPKTTILVSIQAGGVHEAADQQGVASLLSRLMQEGTTSRPAATVAEQVARMGGSLSVYAGDDQTQIYADCLSEFAPDLVGAARRRGAAPGPPRRRAAAPQNRL
ncbi:MAG: insulinase family protein [Hymenobacter sp.]